MPTFRRTRIAALAATGALLSTAFGGLAESAPGQGGAPPRTALQGDVASKPDKDVRPRGVAPLARQRELAQDATVRWNSLGTPATVTKGGKALASGLPKDPEQAARAYLSSRRELFGLSPEGVRGLEKVAVHPLGKGASVLLRQRFGDLAAGVDGLVAVGVNGGKVVHVTSTLSRATDAPKSATMAKDKAIGAAAKDAGIALKAAENKDARLVAVPTAEGARSAYQVTLIDAGGSAEVAAYMSYVDARTGDVLIRQNLVAHAADPDNPRWKIFNGTPRVDYASQDTRKTWCFIPRAGCDVVGTADPATGKAWDVDHTTGTPTNTSLGNAARTFENRDNGDPFSVGTRTNAPKPDRNYNYPWANQWYEKKCDPASFNQPGEVDLEAAISNLYASHNRIHDWSYHLGFTETAWNMQTNNGDRGGLGGDPEQGNAQAGARGVPEQRDNANQITPREGLPPITNMYMWQPIAGAFYAPCVDGDYDMNVIVHEYAHAISARMIGGPDSAWSGPQAGAMNESTSDLLAQEFFNEHVIPSGGNSQYVIGSYVTGNKLRGIRNYDMSRSPLNYSDMAYDLVGTQTHADGEIWSATQYDVRKAFVKRYGKGTTAVQRACAAGSRPLSKCPGNRRWMQMYFDGLLLMADPAVSYVDHRDAQLAADAIRFGGKNAGIMGREFARHGLGTGAFSNGGTDADPIPSFQSPSGKNATLKFSPSGDAKGKPARLYVGNYEGRVVPIADTDPATPRGATFRMVPGTYSFLAVGAGFGHQRFTARVSGSRTLSVSMTRNHAALSVGAKATGDGVNADKLVDETEGTNWASLTAPAAGRQVTVDLAGDKAVKVKRVQVSAALRPIIGDPADPGTQNRFTALRSFQVLACNANAGVDCTQDSSYKVAYSSKADAFPAGIPRPVQPDLVMKSFKISSTSATHLRLKVVSSQCTGAPAYKGEQDADPRFATDCVAGNPTVAAQVRAAEFQAFSR